MKLATTFLTLILKRFSRSPSFGKDLTIQIILGVIAIAAIAYFLILGFYLEPLIVNALKQPDAVAFLNKYLAYYFIGEFIIRYFVQSLPALDVRPLLHLPVRRSTIGNFFLGLSLVQVVNIFVFILFSRFAFSAVASSYGTLQAWIWLLSLWLLSLALHYVVVLLKITSGRTGWKILVVIAVCSLVAADNYFSWIQFSVVAENFFNAISEGYTVVLSLLATLVVLHYFTHRVVLGKLYPEELKVQEHRFSHSTNFSFLENLGQTGMWVKLEVKLIFRNKRTQQTFFMSTMFLLQEAILCYTMEEHRYGEFLFMAITATGLFMASYGQYAFSWQGDHFDFTLSQPTSLRAYVESKFWLLESMTGIWFIFSVPLVYFGWDVLLINIAGTLYNIGINSFIVMNMAMLHTTRLTLKGGGALNYEGAGAAQWLMGFPFLFIPIIIYATFNWLGYGKLGIAVVGLVGLTGIILHKKGIDFTYKRFLARRYTIASSFRKE